MADVGLVRVTKRFGDVAAVDDLSLKIPSGEFLVIVGPSGCGKTTLLRLIAGLEELTPVTSIWMASGQMKPVLASVTSR